MGESRWGTGGPDPPPPPENEKNVRFLSNTGPDPLKNHKATKPVIIGSPAKCHINGVSLANLQRYLDPLSPHQLKTKLSNLDPRCQNFLGPLMSEKMSLGLLQLHRIVQTYIPKTGFHASVEEFRIHNTGALFVGL